MRECGCTVCAAALSGAQVFKFGPHFQVLRNANRARQAAWPGGEHVDLAFRGLEIGGETGELQEAVKKFLRATRGIAGSTAGMEEITDEAGDVVIAVDLLCLHLGIDLWAAVAHKFNKTSRKYNLPIFIQEP